MRFFKYLVLFLSAFVSISAYADMYFLGYPEPTWRSDQLFSSPDSACRSFVSHMTSISGLKYEVVEVTETRCTFKTPSGSGYASIGKKAVACPTGEEKDFRWWSDLQLPAQVCLNKCVYLKSGPTKCVQVDSEGGLTRTDLCGPYLSNGSECDQPDPDPNSQPKPPLRPDECKNSTGSDSYCDKPPDRGCPVGYKQAMFNNKQICVKDSPNDPNPNDPNNGPDDPDDPDDPNNPPNPNGCNKSYCDKPPDNSCPVGYYQARYQGKDICVKNNPNPNGPNPNDPNNGNGDGTGDGDNGGGDGGIFCEKSGKAICDAVTAIKDFFTDEHELPADEHPDIQEHDLGNYESNYVTWSAQCPPDNNVHINVMGRSSTLVLSWQPWCTLLSKLRWVIIACAYFAAAYIILGMR